jgi:hypothetical protein
MHEVGSVTGEGTLPSHNVLLVAAGRIVALQAGVVKFHINTPKKSTPIRFTSLSSIGAPFGTERHPEAGSIKESGS